MPSETPIEENDDMLLSEHSPFLALYRRDADLTSIAKMEFQKKGQSTISCSINARTQLGTVAFLDIKLISPSWESRSVVVTLAKMMTNRVAEIVIDSEQPSGSASSRSCSNGREFTWEKAVDRQRHRIVFCSHHIGSTSYAHYH
jgi:hypothetical protein